MYAKIIGLIAALALHGCISLAAQAPAIQPPAGDQQANPQNSWAESCEDFDDWDKAGPPFRIHGSSFYVGTCGIGAILIAGDDGHVLIDTGTLAGAKIVAANIERLGFDPKDVRYILSSHEHFDHVGGMAWMRAQTGAKVVASAAAATVLKSGEAAQDDPQHGSLPAMEPATVDRVLDGNMVIQLGAIRLLAIPTPGHTSGALTWLWRSCDGQDCKDIVYADSLSAVSADNYRFSDHPVYLRSFRDALARLRIHGRTGCSILLTPHPSASGMRDKLIAGDLTAKPRCSEYAEMQQQRLQDRLAKEGAKTGNE